MEKTGRWLHTDGAETTVKPANDQQFTLPELQSMVGGAIELIPVARTGKRMEYLVVNEDGRRLQLPLNVKATEVMVSIGRREAIVGNAVIVPLELIS